MCPGAKPKDKRAFTCAELEAEAKAPGGRTLLAVDGKVLDLTRFKVHHPGGAVVLENVAGRDVTDAFVAFHPPQTIKQINSFVVGELVDLEARGARGARAGERFFRAAVPPARPLAPSRAPRSRPRPRLLRAQVTPVLRDFRALRERLWADGLFDSRPYWHLALYIRIVMMWAAGVACVVAGRDRGSVGLQLFGGALIGFFWQQFALFAHDGCHNSLTHVRATDYMVMVCSTGLLGISPTWWKDSHNHHHVITNSIDCDQDIQHLPFLSVSEKYFGGVLSKYHRKVLPWDAFSKFMVSRQHLLYIPIMMLARVNLYVQSFVFLLGFAEARDVATYKTHKKLELFSMSLFYVWFSWATLQLPTAAARALFVLVSHAVSGMLHVQITISHFSMDTCEGCPYGGSDPDLPAQQEDWVRWQLASTMDVDCPRCLDWFHGGLQFQVEHHLFPRMPRANLRKCQEEYIKPFCAAHKLHHHNPGFWGSLGETLACLKAVALKARALPPGAVKFEDSMLWDGMCARG